MVFSNWNSKIHKTKFDRNQRTHDVQVMDKIWEIGKHQFNPKLVRHWRPKIIGAKNERTYAQLRYFQMPEQISHPQHV